MTRPMTEADVLAAAQARISRPSAERDALTALLHWRRTEESTGYSNQEWWDATASLRDAADRLIEVDAYQVTEATSEQIVRGDRCRRVGGLVRDGGDLVSDRATEAAGLALLSELNLGGIYDPEKGQWESLPNETRALLVRLVTPVLAAVREQIAAEVTGIALEYRATSDEMHRVVMAREPHDFTADDVTRYAAYASAWESAAARIARGAS
jgi:hypothetical protein